MIFLAYIEHAISTLFIEVSTKNILSCLSVRHVLNWNEFVLNLERSSNIYLLSLPESFISANAIWRVIKALVIPSQGPHKVDCVSPFWN